MCTASSWPWTRSSTPTWTGRSWISTTAWRSGDSSSTTPTSSRAAAAARRSRSELGSIGCEGGRTADAARPAARSPSPAQTYIAIDHTRRWPSIVIQLDDGPGGQFSHVAHRLEVGTGDMGAENDGGQAEQRISRFGRFVVEHVQTAAGGVDQQAAGAHLCQKFPVHHAARGLGERQVQADDVGFRYELVEAKAFDLKLLEDPIIDQRIAGDDLHAEGPGAEGDRLADSPQADQPQRLAPHRRDQPAVPASRMDGSVVRDDIAGKCQNQGEGLLGNAVVVGSRGDCHDDVAAGRRP